MMLLARTTAGVGLRTTFALLVVTSAAACAPSNAPQTAPSKGPSRNASAKSNASSSASTRAQEAAPLAEFRFDATRIVVEPCRFEEPLVSEKSLPLTSIARSKQHLYVADGSSKLGVYAVGAGCSLSLDKSVGTNGGLRGPREIATLSSANEGTVIASNGAFDGTLIRNDKVVGPCSHHYMAIHPSGAWGLGAFVGSDVEKFTVNGDKCTTAPWVLRNLGEDAARKGPFRNVNSISFGYGLALVGGILATERETRVVIGFDEAGTEQLRFGAEDVQSAGHFGWVHSVAECGGGFCVADGNYSRISVWTREGALIGAITMDRIFGTTVTRVLALASWDNDVIVGISARTSAGPTEARVVRLVFSKTAPASSK